MTILNVHSRLPVLLAFFMLMGCATAAGILYPVNDDPLKSKAGIYQLDPTHSNIIFAVNHLGFSMHHGRFNRLEGSLDLNVDAPQQSHLFIKIDTSSIDTNNIELDNLLKGERMFHTAGFPYASFESSTIQLSGENMARIDGMLTIKGVRKPVSIEATFVGSGTNPESGLKTVGFSGSAEFQRSDFALNAWLPFVGDTVTLTLQAEFTKK